MEPTYEEKHATQQINPSNNSSTIETIDLAAIPQPTSKLQRLANRLEAATGIEARGIERVPEAERERKYAVKDYLYMAMIWFSANCTANQLTVGILGPIAYGLGFVDAMICCLFGTILGSCLTGYISTFGPLSGNRTLVIARYTMGWYLSKICVLLNLVIEIGYGVVDTIVAGLILSAVNGRGMSVIVGIIITAIISWMISTFGIKFFNMFERFIWIPQVCILFIFVGVAAPYFDVDTPSKATGVTVVGNRLSYVFLSASGPLGWSPAAADFYVYFPPQASRWAVFAMTSSGLILGKLFVEFLGIGLGSGLAKNPTWAAAFDNSTGALIVEALGPLGGFGKFLAVVLALGVVANNIPGTYSASLSFQILATWALKIPCVVWSTVAVVIYTVCAIAGRDNLLTIFLNFLALIGYWTIIWITLTMEEELIFRRKSGYDWASWNDSKSMPIGIAALSAFLVGWIGAILGMDQTYFVGPIAKLIGAYGSDIGLPLAAAWSAIVYPPLRGMELRYFGR